jgi:signal transduction histidine kinase
MILPASGRTSLVQPSQPSSREFRNLPGSPRTLLSWATVPVPNTSMDLVAAAFVDQEQILRGFRRALAEQAFWALLILGFGVIAARFLASRMSKPIEQMVAATRVIQTGDFQVRLAADRPDELGDLATAFNLMGQGLDDREKALKSAQMALVQSEKLAALGTLSAGIAHEVKNPLAGILGHADMALDGAKKLNAAPDSPLLRHLETIQKEVKRCRGIIDNLMRFSRKDTENKVENEPMDLEIVCWEAIHLTEHSLNMQKVKIEKNFSKDAMMILGNSNQIEQVVLNMIQNAGHAMPDGGTIKVSTEFFDDEGQAPIGAFLAYQNEEFKGSFMRVTISDTGIGMSEEVQRKIFEPFFTTKPKGVGTGLGLSVTMGILGDHHARVSLNSAPGQGTAFLLDFMTKESRSEKVLAQLEELRHRSGGGAKLASDVGGASTPVSVLAPVLAPAPASASVPVAESAAHPVAAEAQTSPQGPSLAEMAAASKRAAAANHVSPRIVAKPLVEKSVEQSPDPRAIESDGPVSAEADEAPELVHGFGEAEIEDPKTVESAAPGAGLAHAEAAASKPNPKFSIRKPVVKKNVG